MAELKKDFLDLLFEESEEKKENSKWDFYTPIIEKEKRIDVFIANEITEPFEYNKLKYMLLTASEDVTFYFHINTPGGMNDGTYHITSAMSQTKAKIVEHLSGSVASNGTVLTMYCDEIEVDPNTLFMIHEERGGYAGTFSETKAYNEFKKLETPSQFKRDYKNFLTEEEIDKVLDGKDMWMNADEVTRRWTIKTNS